MTQIKYTKTELRSQQFKLGQLEKYLPTLQLKKMMIQLEIVQASQELEKLFSERATVEDLISSFQPLLTDKKADSLFDACQIISVNKRFENIAGVEIPLFEGIVFQEPTYSLFDTPVWLESAIGKLKSLITVREKITLYEEKKKLLEKELREVSIRVNLFEKIMIPRAQENIKKIKIFLGDQQLAAVSQAKVAKRKILKRRGVS